jgi:hypothetical protein
MNINLGTALTNFGEKPLTIDLDRRQFRHGWLLGKSATGKSTLFRNVIVEANHLVDPQTRKIRTEIVNEAAPKVATTPSIPEVEGPGGAVQAEVLETPAQSKKVGKHNHK